MKVLSRCWFSVSLLLPSAVLALPGDLDTSFGGGDGWVGSGTPIIQTADVGRDVVQQADGKLVVAGASHNGANNDFGVVRYNSDGSLDTGFSADGKLTTAIGTGIDYAYSVTQQADGKLVVVGSSYNGSNNDVAVARYNSDGSLDTTFSGDGKVITAAGAGNELGYSVTQQTDGKLVVAGYSNNGSNDDFVLVRYNADGSLDSGFDGDGVATTAIGAAADQAWALVQQSDGKLVAVGSSNNGSNNDVAVVRYNSDGSLDTGFDGDGKASTAVGSAADVGYSVIQQSDGKLVVAGSSNNGSNDDFALVRYNSDGSLDTGFDTDGKLVTAVGSAADIAYSLVQQASGKLVAGGYSRIGSTDDVALVRYNSNGALDTSFDGDGKLTTAIGAATDIAYSLIQQADGKLVVAGYSNNGTSDDFAAVRYSADGVLDTGFDGDGKASTNVNLRSQDTGRAMVRQTDGKLVMAGFSRVGAADDITLLRYSADGTLDSSFSSDGVLTMAIGSTADAAYAVIQQADGKLVAAGYSHNGSNNDFALVRFNGDGSLDTAFDSDGKAAAAFGTTGIDVANAVIQQADGKLVVAGSSNGGSNDDFALARFNANGSLDASFDGDGKLTTAVGSSADVAYAVLQQADGKLLAVGYSQTGSNNDIAVVRYNSDGSLDTSFDGDGKLVTALGSSADVANAAILQADGKLLVAGYSRTGTNDDIALVRYNSDGTLDTSFDGDGWLVTAVGGAADVAFAVVQQTDGKLVAAGYSNNGSNADFALVRYNSDGSLDTDFSGDGRVTLSVADSTETAYALLEQPDGKLVMAGYALGVPSGQEFVAARFDSGQLNTDGDELMDALDTDDDNDGVADGADAFPLDTAEWSDTDSDGMGDNGDNCPLLANADQLDTDSDDSGNVCDGDDDNDGVADGSDAFPLDSAEWVDADSDGTGNNADPDDDNDSVADGADAFPFNPAESVDTDSDGTGNNADPDDDNDGVADGSDAFPLDAAESVDTDSDGIGNNADPDDDNDGTPDTYDPEPLNPLVGAAFPLDGVYRGSSIRESIGPQ